MSRRHIVTMGGVEIVNQGQQVSVQVLDYAREKIAELARYTGQPILHVRIRLDNSPDPAVKRPARARADLDVNGRLLRNGVDALTPREAIDTLLARLRQQLRRMVSRRKARRGGTPSPTAWRHGPAVPDRLPYAERPAEQRQIVRHTAYEPPLASTDEAVFDLDELGFDFHLFTDEYTGQEAVVYRTGPTGYALFRLRPVDGPEPETAVRLTVSPHPAPTHSTRQALDRLVLTGQPFVFYADAETGRGCVVHHRSDGRYGLTTPPVGPFGPDRRTEPEQR